MHCVWRQQNTQMRKIGIHEVQPCTVLPEKRSEARSLPDAFLHLFWKSEYTGDRGHGMCACDRLHVCLKGVSYENRCCQEPEAVVQSVSHDLQDPERNAGGRTVIFCLRETLHKARLPALHAICVQIFRHIAQKSLARHTVCLRNFYAICRKI